MPEEAAREEELRALADRLGVGPCELGLFDRALTHASAVSDVPQPSEHYESLEFLGDAVLGLAVAHHLYETRPGLSPGEYSHMRAGLVNQRVVARVARELALGAHIRLGKGEELSGGRERNALLADCLEALIGAIYLDRGWEFARAFIERCFARDLERIEETAVQWDFKSRLQTHCQALQWGLPRFEVVRSDGPDHRKEFEVEVYVSEVASGRGRGASKKEAEQNAAREALLLKGVILGQAPPTKEKKNP